MRRLDLDRACAIQVLIREGWDDARIAGVVGCDRSTVCRHRASGVAVRLALRAAGGDG